jgi:uncharacterized protein YgiM (DUF1202 family)/uncharacterized protein YvpB
MEQQISRRGLMLGAVAGTVLLPFVVPGGTGAVTGTAVVTTDVLRIRSGPSTGFPIIGRTYLGDTVQILEGPTNGFYRITAGSVTGWSSVDYLRVTAATTPPPTSPPTGTGTATVTQNLNLRQGPGTSYAILKVMPKGATVTIRTGPSGGWYQVDYQGVTGWASAQYLSVGTGTTPPTTGTKTATIAVELLNLRSSGTLSGAILGRMVYGETVEILATAGEWYKVNYHGTTGYAYGPYLRFGGSSASMWVPIHQQEHNLSCEYASCQIATAGLGNEIHEDRFIPIVGTDPNPHRGFRGNIDGTFIYGYEDYGVYVEPLVAALPQFGFVGRQLTGGKTELISELAAHHPVVLWIDLGYTSSFMYNINGEMVLMATQSHVVCGYGYNDEGVLISDPDSSRRKRVIPWDSFMRMWDSMDQYAMAVTRT